MENKDFREVNKIHLKIKADDAIIYNGEVGKDYCGESFPDGREKNGYVFAVPNRMVTNNLYSPQRIL